MKDAEFSKLVKSSIQDLPKEFLDKLENVSIVTDNWPTKIQLDKTGVSFQRSLLLGLYEGVPQTKRGRYGVGGQLPDKITIFKNPILMISRSVDDVRRIVKETVIHEIAHHFGMSEEQIRGAKK